MKRMAIFLGLVILLGISVLSKDSALFWPLIRPLIWPLTFAKGILITFFFMEIAEAHLFWRFVTAFSLLVLCGSLHWILIRI